MLKGEAVVNDVLERPMAKQSESARIDKDVLHLCRLAADYKGVSLSEYISGHMRPIAEKDIDEGHAKLRRPGKRPKASE